MIILGLTGSIAMGKSTAASMLQHMGVPVHDSDAAVHQIYKSDPEFHKQMYDYFLEAYMPFKKTIDRKKLAEIIYNDPYKKYLLEKLLHPKVRQSQQKFIKKCQRLKQDIAVLDIPLLYETEANKRCDAVVVVTAPYHTQKARVLARPGMTEEKFIKILNSQMPDSEKCALADFIVQSGLGRKRMFRELERVIQSFGKTA